MCPFGFKGRGHRPCLLMAGTSKPLQPCFKPVTSASFPRSEFLQIFRESHFEKSLQVYLYQKPTSINQIKRSNYEAYIFRHSNKYHKWTGIKLRVHHPPLLERPTLISQAAFTFVKWTSLSHFCLARGNVFLWLKWGWGRWEGFSENVAIIIQRHILNKDWGLFGRCPFRVGQDLVLVQTLAFNNPGLSLFIGRL